MYCMNFWLVFPKFQGQALNFHLVEAAELLNYLSPLYGPDLYNYIWNFESHIYYFWEVQTKTSIRSNNINFFFNKKRRRKKGSWYTIDGWWTFYLKFQQASSCRESNDFTLWMFTRRCKEHVIVRVPNTEDYGESLMLLYRHLLAILKSFSTTIM